MQSQATKGNISAMEWYTAYGGNQKRSYQYKYDQLNRMKDAVYSPDDIFSERIMRYDKNGNILRIIRSGYVDDLGVPQQNFVGHIDNLSLRYNGNQQINIMENEADADWIVPVGTNDFRDRQGALNDNAYLYDANGNMTGDYNKNIVNIKYNYLNLPEMIQFSNGNTCEYLYDAAGVKHRAIYRTSLEDMQLGLGDEFKTNPELFLPYPTQTDYCGNFIHEYGDYTLKKILTPEGYIEYDMDYSYYCYNIKDHLGNNRVLLRAGKDQKYFWTDMVTHYYPFGMEFSSRIKGDSYNWLGNPYRYNGKELDPMHGLNWYDYGARWYDPTIAKWSVVDPLGEVDCSVSPYLYCHNNPVNRTDPTGMYDLKEVTVTAPAPKDNMYYTFTELSNTMKKNDQEMASQFFPINQTTNIISKLALTPITPNIEKENKTLTNISQAISATGIAAENCKIYVQYNAGKEIVYVTLKGATAAVNTQKVLSALKGIGNATIYLGTFVDGLMVANGTLTKEKALVNLGVTIVAVCIGGIPGAVIGGGYVILDQMGAFDPKCVTPSYQQPTCPQDAIRSNKPLINNFK